MAESRKVAITFYSVDKILLCDHSNEAILTVLSLCTVYFSEFCRKELINFVEF